MTAERDIRQRWSDGQLLSAVAARDGQAFTTFYQRHLPVALAFLIRETGNPELAADLAAEVFATVLLNAGRFEDRGNGAAPWVIGIARNKLLMSLRRGRIEARARRRLGYQAVELRESDLDRVVAAADRGSGPLAALVQALPAEERRAVLARVVQERSYREIAAELQCSEMVVRKRVSRGLARVREQVTDR